jgi:beta-phosphoglucomutase family hydrolase
MISKAVIWDMDGVIADTAPFHFKAWQEVARQGGKDLDEEDFRRLFGLRNADIISIIFGEGIAPDEVERIAAKKEESFRRAARQNIEPLPGAIELLRSLREEGFKMALASSAPRENIELLLGTLGIGEFFDTIVSAKEVAEGKPSPQLFLAAAEGLGTNSGDCLVIEDALAGVKAAKAGGMKCIAVTNTLPRERLLEADLVVDSLKRVTVDTISSLLEER